MIICTLLVCRAGARVVIPVGRVVSTPSRVFPLVPSATTLVTPRAGVSLVAVLVVLVILTLVLVTLVLIPTVSGTLVLVPLVWVEPLTSTLVTLVLLVVAHQVRGAPAGWYLSLVSYPGRMSLFCHITSPCASHALPTNESDQLQP